MKNNNKGYSMVEMIICVAIISVLGALGFLTMNIVYTAKANSAVNTFQTQFATLKTMTEAQDAKTAFRLFYDDTEEQYYIEYGTWDGSAFTASTTKADVALSDRVAVYYKESSSTTESIVNTTGVIVQYNKSDGSVLKGAGTYRFAKSNNKAITDLVLGNTSDAVGSTVDTLKLNKNSGNLTR